MRTLVGLIGCFFALIALAAPTSTDSNGRIVSLKGQAQRIVSLAPHATELLFAAGAGDKLVGVSEYSDYPAAALRLPRISSSGGVDLEKVLSLRPDLVVAWRFEATRGAIDRLEKFGIPVFLSEPRQLAEIAENMEALGVLAGTETEARPAAAALRAGLERLRRDYGGRTQLKVFYHISVRPLMSLNGQHIVSSVIALCGGRNILADAPTIAPVVGAEAVFSADPDVIVSAQRNPQDLSWKVFWKERFAPLRAVQEGRLYSVESTVMHRQGPRILVAVESLCRQFDQARQRSAGREAAGADIPAKADSRR